MSESGLSNNLDNRERQRYRAVVFAHPWDMGIQGWLDILRQPIGEHRIAYFGDLIAGSALLYAMSQGMKDGIAHSGDPDTTLKLAITENQLQPANYDHTHHVVGITVEFLEQLSSYPFSEITTIRRGDGEAIFRGTVHDFAYLMGAEEARHAEYFRTHPLPEEPFTLAKDMSAAAYDAQPHEYDALTAMRDIAMERGMPKETIDCLQERIDNANRYKNSVLTRALKEQLTR